jgi:hypothetical protein
MTFPNYADKHGPLSTPLVTPERFVAHSRAPDVRRHGVGTLTPDLSNLEPFARLLPRPLG